MSSDEDAPHRNRIPAHMQRRAGNLLKVLVSAGLLIYIFSQINLREALGALLAANAWWLAGAFLAFEVTFLLRALRWRALIRDWGIRVPLKDLLTWYLVGSFFNSVLPTGFGGDLLRVYELSRRVDDPILATNSVVVDRYLGLMTLLAMGLAAAPFGEGRIDSRVLLLLAGLFGAGLLGGALLLNQRGWRRVGERLPLVGRFLAGRLSSLGQTASYYSPRALAESAGVSLVFNLVLILSTVLIGFALDVHIPLRYYLVFIPISSATLMLPSVGGLGVREVSYVALFPTVGVSEPAAVSMSLVLYAYTLITGLIGGAIYLAAGAGSYLREARKESNAPQ